MILLNNMLFIFKLFSMFIAAFNNCETKLMQNLQEINIEF